MRGETQGGRGDACGENLEEVEPELEQLQVDGSGQLHRGGGRQPGRLERVGGDDAQHVGEHAWLGLGSGLGLGLG